MSVQTALVAIKTADSTLNTLIGTRFYPDVLPQTKAFPAVRFQIISRTRGYTFGLVAQLNRPRVQMDGYAASSIDRTTLASAMRGAFMGYRNSSAIGGETIQGIRLDDEEESIEMLDTGTEAYRVRMDFICDFEES